VQACREKLPGAQLHNLYGPTEAAVDVTAWTCPPSFAGGVVPIGLPIANTRIYLLDEQGQPAPLGATGELYIGGDGVARGYLNRPELTAERFVRDPFVADTEARMYRTGDLARYLPDGNLEYLGRNDFQVKIRGFRIELGEIEARLSEHALVRDAVVEARDTGDEKRLAAYVIPADETIETDELVAALRAHLATTLPDYMVPAAFVRMGAWPLTPNGKLDRKALPAPDDEAYARREYEAPQGEIEQTLAGLWRELLQIERVGRQDDFFELGGHSLTATRLLARIRQALGVELPVATVFARSTLMTLAQAVAEASATAQALLPIAPTPRDGVLPLSFAQQRLWFLAQLEGVSATYHIPVALRLRGALDRAALRRALDAVLARHEGLRSVFVAVDGQPQVRLLPETTGLSLIEHDLRGREDASLELARLSKEEARAPFDLAQGPLIRGRLVQLAEDDHVMLLTQHHIVSDGWSIGVLSRELTTLYQAFQQDQANPLPRLTIQYPDYAAWQRAWLSGERLERQIGYWREALTGAPAATGAVGL
jgi:acyl carrier protein